MTDTERPVALDLCVGLGGWAEGLISEGWRVIGIDIEDMFAALGETKPEHLDLVIEDICRVRGEDYAHVDLIVGSSPCQDFSYRAMPWTRAKALHAPFLGMFLFWQQFRIQREASEAKGRHIPMVVENVRGAIHWVGPSAWNFGSYHLWGDVPALMPNTMNGRKNPGFRFDGSGKSFQTESVQRHVEGVKVPSYTGRRTAPGAGARFTTRDCGAEAEEGRKGPRGAWFNDDKEAVNRLSVTSSRSPARKAAAAKIAKIPLALSQHIARVYKP